MDTEKTKNFFTENQKKILFLFGLFLTVFCLIGLYFLFFRDSPESDTETPTDPFGPRDGLFEPLPPDQVGSPYGPDDPMPRLRQISFVPTSGAVTFERLNDDEETSRTIIRFTERGTGHIYETSTDSFETYRISNTTIPRIHESFWLKDGQSQIVRYLDPRDNQTIKSYFGKISENTKSEEEEPPSQTFTGEFLPDDIKEMAVSKESGKIIYLLEEFGINYPSGVKGFLKDADSGQIQQIFDSALTEWLIDWPRDNQIFLTTKPASGVEGFMFRLNKQNGALRRVLKDIPGLTTLSSPNGRYVLYSSSQGNRLDFFVYDDQINEKKEIRIKTLPEKCVWSEISPDIAYCGGSLTAPSAPLPDAWYKGLINFADGLFFVNAKTGFAENLSAFSGERELDIFRPFLDEKEDYLFFLDKRTMTLWSYEL